MIASQSRLCIRHSPCRFGELPAPRNAVERLWMSGKSEQTGPCFLLSLNGVTFAVHSKTVSHIESKERLVEVWVLRHLECCFDGFEAAAQLWLAPVRTVPKQSAHLSAGSHVSAWNYEPHGCKLFFCSTLHVALRKMASESITWLGCHLAAESVFLQSR
jgi:hypothetical protein